MTEHLELERSPITGTKVDRVFSPVCECARDLSVISFVLRRRETVTLDILNPPGADVRSEPLVRNRREPAGRVSYTWDGRDNARPRRRGGRLPAARGGCERNGRTIVLPNPIRVDTTAPVITLVRVFPRVFSPDGDGRRDRVTATYRIDERAGAVDARGRAAAGAEQVPAASRGPRVVRPCQRPYGGARAPTSPATCRRPRRQPLDAHARGVRPGQVRLSSPASASRWSQGKRFSVRVHGRAKLLRLALRGETRCWPARGPGPARARDAGCVPRSTSRSAGGRRARRSTSSRRHRHREAARSSFSASVAPGTTLLQGDPRPLARDRDSGRVVLRAPARAAPRSLGLRRALPRRRRAHLDDPRRGGLRTGRRRSRAFARACRRAPRSRRSSRPTQSEAGKPRWGDKTPMYMRHLGLLESLFPDARYVHLIRDGRDAALSFLGAAGGDLHADVGAPRDTGAVRMPLGQGGCRTHARSDGASAPPATARSATRSSSTTRRTSLPAICEFAEIPFEPDMLDVADAVDVSAKPHQQRLLRPPTDGRSKLARGHVRGGRRRLRAGRRGCPRPSSATRSRRRARVPEPRRLRSRVRRTARRVERVGLGAPALAALAAAPSKAVSVGSAARRGRGSRSGVR